MIATYNSIIGNEFKKSIITLTIYVVVFSGGPVLFFSARLLLEPSASTISNNTYEIYTLKHFKCA